MKTYSSETRAEIIAGSTATLVILYVIITTIHPDIFSSLFTSHSNHEQIVKQPIKSPLQTDPDTRYILNSDFPSDINPLQEVSLSFKIFDTTKGSQTVLFTPLMSKLMHLIVVDSTLTYYDHIHPTFKDGIFSVKTTFPKAGVYYLYTDFKPYGSVEQQLAAQVHVCTVTQTTLSTSSPESGSALIKIFGTTEVTLTTPSPLIASRFSVGTQTVSFTLKDAQTKKPLANLKPYLDAFGHLIMINTKTFDYVHIHSADMTVPSADATGGHSQRFLN